MTKKQAYHPVEYILMVVTSPVWIPVFIILAVAAGIIWALLFAFEFYDKVFSR